MYKNNHLYKKQEDILLCLDDYNEILKKKFEIIDKTGSLELVKWIDQYNRKGWFPIATQLDKDDIDNIIRHTVKINNMNGPFRCSVCKNLARNQIWVCMEDKCINNQYSTDLSLLYQSHDLKPFHTIII